MTDTREKLEAEIRGKVAYGTSTLLYPPSANKVTQYLPSLSLDTVFGWLDRQAAITERECLVQSVQGADAILTAENAELQARLEKSHRDWLVDAGEYEQVADGMKKQIAELLEQVDELQSRLEAQERETACQSADYVAEQKRSIELQAQVESLENMASSYERRIETLEAERDELQAECEARGRALESNLKRIHELEANSIPLPLDADGVPIRVGDTVEYSDGYEMWTMRVGMIGRECVEECESGVVAKICRHVNPRAVEDVLLDVIEHAICPSNSWDEIIAKYAAELRMVGE